MPEPFSFLKAETFGSFHARPIAGGTLENAKLFRSGDLHAAAPEERMIRNYRRFALEYPLIGAALRGIADEGVPAETPRACFDSAPWDTMIDPLPYT